MSEQQSIVHESLKPFVERMRSLQSAWSALAPSGARGAGQSIADLGRVLSQKIAQLAEAGLRVEGDTAEDLDHQLDKLATMMSGIAQDVAPAQLRSNLPARVRSNRRSVLDLLDLMISRSREHPDMLTNCLGSIDYLVTLLCTGGEGQGIRHDPVTLTPSMNALCMQVKGQDENLVREIEAEFFAAANLEGEEVQEEITLRKLRTQKAGLGLLFFAPRILRSVVTYNATLAERLADDLWSSQDWGPAVAEIARAAASQAETESTCTSVFESEPMRELAAALCRRSAGGVPEANDLDRVVWCLDLDLATGAERKALLRADTGTRENILGTAILVGLVSRSSMVLSIELQTIGISPDGVTDRWVPELCEIFQTEVGMLIGKNAYQQAQKLSDLKNKFLLPGSSDALLQESVSRSASSPLASVAVSELNSKPTSISALPPKASRESARDLVRDALEAQRNGKSRSKSATSDTSWLGTFPWSRVVPGVAAVVAMIYMTVQMLGGHDLNPNLNRFGEDVLAEVSPYLSEGYRNGEGYGPAFVGTVQSSFFELPSDSQEEAAGAIVENLRVLGVRQIMIYDRDGDLRIQAVGSQDVRTL